MRPHPNRLVSLAQLFTDFRSRGEYAQERQGASLLCPGKGHDHCQHDPAQSRAASRAFTASEGAVALLPSFPDLAAPPPLQCLINAQLHACSGFHKGLNKEKQELATHGYRGPPCSIEHLMRSSSRWLPAHCHWLAVLLRLSDVLLPARFRFTPSSVFSTLGS